MSDILFTVLMIVFFGSWILLAVGFILKLVFSPFLFVRRTFALAPPEIRRPIFRYLLKRLCFALGQVAFGVGIGIALWAYFGGPFMPDRQSGMWWPMVAFNMLLFVGVPLISIYSAYETLTNADDDVRCYAEYYPAVGKGHCKLCSQQALGGRNSAHRDPELCSSHNIEQFWNGPCPFL